MTEEQYNNSKAEFLAAPAQPQQSAEQPSTDDNDFATVLGALRRPRPFLKTPPTFIPHNAFEAEQDYDDGTHRRRYFYINGNWRYVTLT